MSAISPRTTAPRPRYWSGRRVMAVTSWPAASSASATCRPTNPVAPVTRIFTSAPSRSGGRLSRSNYPPMPPLTQTQPEARECRAISSACPGGCCRRSRSGRRLGGSMDTSTIGPRGPRRRSRRSLWYRSVPAGRCSPQASSHARPTAVHGSRVCAFVEGLLGGTRTRSRAPKLDLPWVAAASSSFATPDGTVRRRRRAELWRATICPRGTHRVETHREGLPGQSS